MRYTLGLNLGVASIGWAIIEIDKDNNPIKIVKLGVRLFHSGTGNVSEIACGKDESRTKVRRDARHVRRNFWRRKRRTLKTFNILRNAGLLPMGNGINDSPADRDAIIKALDQHLLAELQNEGVQTDILPYTLRALALDKPLPPFALGRIFLHLSKRRGFLSNRKTAVKEGEDEGKVKGAISDLSKEMKEKGFRTLGQYLASLDPQNIRIRQRYTGRQMYQDEFAEIWSKQAEANGKLTPELRDKLFKALFYQRPLKSWKNLIGKCSLEPNCRRAASASVDVQRFRYWQKILDLEVQDLNGIYRSLTREEQDKLAEALEHNEKLTFAAIRKLLGLTARGAYKFNLETEGVKGISGNSTITKIKAILGEQLKVQGSHYEGGGGEK